MSKQSKVVKQCIKLIKYKYYKINILIHNYSYFLLIVKNDV